MANIRAARPSRTPTWVDSVVFVALMSGPPKFRDRDATASLVGAVDWVVLLHIFVWGCGALWVFVRLYPSLLARSVVPALNTAQVVGGLLIAALSLSLWQSPGILLTAFTLGQFAIMLSFSWIFVDRFGPSPYLRHVFAGVCVLTAMLIAAAFLNPGMVIVGADLGLLQLRFRGERIAVTGAVAVIGLVLCLSDVPRLRTIPFVIAVPLFGVLLMTSRMRTAYGGMLIYLAIGYVFGRGLRVRRLVPLLAAVSIALLVLDSATSTAAYLARDNKSIENMSDRVPLWEHLTKAVMEDEPVIGLGYYAASRILAPQHNERLGNAHSVFFEVFVGGGIVATTVYVALCAYLLGFAARLLRTGGGHPEAVAAVGLLVITLVLGITSSEAAHAGPVGFIFWSMTALLPRMCRDAVPNLAYTRVRLRGPASPIRRREHASFMP